MHILIVGGGNMGLTYARSFLRSHITTEEQMMILEKSPEKAAQLATLGVGTVYGNPEDCIQHADLIILAVKPQDSQTLFPQLKPLLHPQQLVLSIMAGMKMTTITKGLGAVKVIRAMPNLPAQIGRGMTVFTSSDQVTRIELVMVQNLLATTGKTVYADQEDMIDASTAISGSGPAYVWHFMDALMQAARRMGFSTSEAELLVTQTFAGAIELFQASDYSCTEWIKRVSSRGGTTEAAMYEYDQRAVANDIAAGAFAALKRAEELGQAK